MFKNNSVKKTYWAIVANKPPKTKDTLTHYLVRNTKQNKSYCHSNEIADSKKAILHYHVIAESERYWLVEVDLETGRHHQIRAQLASIGCPIRGDLKYGYSRSNKYPGICLHAREINFIHPVKKEPTRIIAQPPKMETLWTVFMNQLAHHR